ncbi:hypothetical protein PRIPAC_77321 [Pristionchus pacificus]|uniref:Elongation of very long chain fatty acids protein n=1 Tax=Pristionchus pacificus TaxID=54126 RepID=A0A2A6C433_PRIPA|nr:hypothetical protein PRIPAC_77321 [Pristionchus pacificus]|eukprot:PDM72924.1 hypothetical protein PRIPAC_39358 [Pristionchus pacificus]
MVYKIFNDTYPAVVEGHGERLYFIPYEYQTQFAPEKWWHDLDHEHMYLVVRENWTLAVWAALLYISGIHALQSSLKNRKPWDLKWPLIIWNSFFALFSLVIAIRMCEEFMYVVRRFPLLDSISYSPDVKQPAAFCIFLFVISKALQLGDTVFIVLRKKPLIFLHWYHHAVALVYVWHAGKEGVAAGRVLAIMNCCIHFLMYSYYALSAGGIRIPRVIAGSISMLQISEMFAAVAVSCIVLVCKLQGRIMQHSDENLAFCFTIYLSFAILFSMKAFHVEKRKTKFE